MVSLNGTNVNTNLVFDNDLPIYLWVGRYFTVGTYLHRRFHLYYYSEKKTEYLDVNKAWF